MATDMQSQSGRPEAELSPARPTAVRRHVVVAAFLLACVLYLDRAALSVLAPAIRRDLGIGPMGMSWIFSAFVWGYALFHLPAGWLGDRFGPRRVLAGIVLLWSAFTGTTAAAWNLASMVAIRFAFGAAEAGATPNVSRAFARWIPRVERGRAQGIFLAGMGAGGAVAAPLVTWLLLRFSWRIAFVLLACVGVVWSACWLAWFRDRPSEHSGVNAAERELIGEEGEDGPAQIDWRRLVREPNLRAILLMYFTYGYTGYIYITWFPSYLIESRHLSVEWTAFLAALPLALGVAAKPLGGFWSDWLTARRGLRYGRRMVGFIGFAIGAAAALPGVLISNPYAAALLLSVADGGAALAHGVCFAVCLDVGMKRAGTFSALMLTAGSLGNAASALAFGAFLEATGSWIPPFAIAIAANFLGALLWLKIDPENELIV